MNFNYPITLFSLAVLMAQLTPHTFAQGITDNIPEDVHGVRSWRVEYVRDSPDFGQEYSMIHERLAEFAQQMSDASDTEASVMEGDRARLREAMQSGLLPHQPPERFDAPSSVPEPNVLTLATIGTAILIMLRRLRLR